MTPIGMLEIDGLTVVRDGRRVLSGVDMVVGPREAVVVLGPNGAGKTTLLRTIAGLERPSAGSVVYAGQRLDRLTPAEIVRAGISLLPERNRVFPALTVAENLRAGVLAHSGRGLGRLHRHRIRPSDVDWVLEVFPGLRPVAYQQAGSLPPGEQQVLALARAMVARPKLLLVDELSAGIAPALAVQLFDVLRTLSETGVAVLVVEQFINLGLELAERVYVLENGGVSVATEPGKVCLSDVSWQSTQPGGGTRASANRGKGAGQ